MLFYPKTTPEMISEGLKAKNFPGEDMPPEPPKWAHFMHFITLWHASIAIKCTYTGTSLFKIIDPPLVFMVGSCYIFLYRILYLVL